MHQWLRHSGDRQPANRPLCSVPGTTAACSASRLLASSCVLDRCLAPGWHRARGRDLLAFRLGDRKGAWHRVRGRDLPAFRLGVAKVPGTNGTPGTIGYRLPTAGHFRWEPANASGWAISRSPPASLLRLGSSRRTSNKCPARQIQRILPQGVARTMEA